MASYSKLIGSIVGGVIGLVGSKYALPPEVASPDVQGALTILLAAFATYFAPANK